MTTTLTEMDEKPEGQRPTSGQRVAEPAAYLAVHSAIRWHLDSSKTLLQRFGGPALRLEPSDHA